MREKYERRADTVRAKVRFVGLHEPHLPDGGRSLLFIDALGALLPTEPKDAFGDRPRTHENHFAPHAAKLGDLSGPPFDRGLVETASVVRDEGTADFDDDAVRVLKK